MAMDRSERRQREFTREVDLASNGFGEGAVIRKVCSVAPLSPEEQLQHLIQIRRATLSVRNEVARFPGVLETLAQKQFAEGTFSHRDEMVAAVHETRALWARRDEEGWREEYERLLTRNAAFALRAFDELYELSERPYADAMAIENQVRQLCRGALAAPTFGANEEIANVRRRYEDLALRPFDDIEAVGRRIRVMDEAAEPSRKIMVESNLRLVARVVSNFKSRVQGGGVDAPGALDLFQEGVFGLLAALDRFRPELGNRFSTYAMHWIKQAIGRSHEENDLISVPHHAKALLARERKVRQQIMDESGEPPREDEVLERMNLSPREYRVWSRAKVLVFEPVSRDEAGEEIDLLDVVPDGSNGERRAKEVADAENRIARGMLRLFEGKSLAVMARRFTTAYERRGHDSVPSLAEVGEELGLTRQRIAQIERAGVDVLSDYFIVESSRPLTRAEVMRRVCRPEERSLIENLIGERYDARVSKSDQVEPLRLCATAIVITEVGEKEWRSFVELTGLSDLRAFLVRDRILDGNPSFIIAVRRAVRAGLAPPNLTAEEAERLYDSGMKVLAPHARVEFQRRRDYL